MIEYIACLALCMAKTQGLHNSLSVPQGKVGLRNIDIHSFIHLTCKNLSYINSALKLC